MPERDARVRAFAPRVRRSARMSRVASIRTFTPAGCATPRARTVPFTGRTGTTVIRDGDPARYACRCGSSRVSVVAAVWKRGAASATPPCQTGKVGATAMRVANAKRLANRPTRRNILTPAPSPRETSVPDPSCPTIRNRFQMPGTYRTGTPDGKAPTRPESASRRPTACPDDTSTHDYNTERGVSGQPWRTTDQVSIRPGGTGNVPPQRCLDEGASRSWQTLVMPLHRGPLPADN